MLWPPQVRMARRAMSYAYEVAAPLEELRRYGRVRFTKADTRRMAA